jgi:uncharacterized caspase-like protein
VDAIEIVVTVLFLASNASFLFFARGASRERQRLVNAVLARTPAEFHMLEAQANKPKKAKKADSDVMSIPPIGL